MGGSSGWMVTEHMQFFSNWIFRDETNPALSRFHMVPTEVTSGLTNLCNHGGNLQGVGLILHRYCKMNWHKLDCFMIFFIRNTGNSHWLLNVAVNPRLMIERVTKKSDGPVDDNELYGYLYLDPQEDMFRNGTIPKARKSSQDDPIRVRQLIFLLNYMS